MDMSADRIPIDAEEALSKYGISASHEQMGNGELRFRLMGSDGNGYIRTVASSACWQNAHFHKVTAETYIVERGWMALAYEGPCRAISILFYEPGQIVTTEILRPHNIYLPAGGLIHTVKHGSLAAQSDWYAAPDFDIKTQSLSEDDLIEARVKSAR